MKKEIEKKVKNKKTSGGAKMGLKDSIHNVDYELKKQNDILTETEKRNQQKEAEKKLKSFSSHVLEDNINDFIEDYQIKNNIEDFTSKEEISNLKMAILDNKSKLISQTAENVRNYEETIEQYNSYKAQVEIIKKQVFKSIDAYEIETILKENFYKILRYTLQDIEEKAKLENDKIRANKDELDSLMLDYFLSWLDIKDIDSYMFKTLKTEEQRENIINDFILRYLYDSKELKKKYIPDLNREVEYKEHLLRKPDKYYISKGTINTDIYNYIKTTCYDKTIKNIKAMYEGDVFKNDMINKIKSNKKKNKSGKLGVGGILGATAIGVAWGLSDSIKKDK